LEGTHLEASPGKEVMENLISSKQTNKKIQVWWSALGKKHRTQPGKQQNKKRAGSMAQVVEYLPHG
jgi:hypothetical protein